VGWAQGHTVSAEILAPELRSGISWAVECGNGQSLLLFVGESRARTLIDNGNRQRRKVASPILIQAVRGEQIKGRKPTPTVLILEPRLGLQKGVTMKKLMAVATVGLILLCLLSLSWYETQVVSSYGYLLRRMGGSATWGLLLTVGGTIACATVGSVTGGLACGLVIAG